MTDRTLPADPRVHCKIFFCPGCRRRIAYLRMTSFCWHLNSFCRHVGKHVRMRRSKNQTIDGMEKDHAPK